jgi:hypothetical protein
VKECWHFVLCVFASLRILSGTQVCQQSHICTVNLFLQPMQAARGHNTCSVAFIGAVNAGLTFTRPTPTCCLFRCVVCLLDWLTGIIMLRTGILREGANGTSEETGVSHGLLMERWHPGDALNVVLRNLRYCFADFLAFECCSQSHSIEQSSRVT